MKNQRKERKSFRKVFLIISILLLTIATLSVTTYAWWNSLQKDKNVEVSVGDTVSIKVDGNDITPSGSFLVPEGQDVLSNHVTSISETYTVSTFHSENEGEGYFDLVVTVKDIKLGVNLLNDKRVLGVIKTSLSNGSETNKTDRALTTFVKQDSVRYITITITLDFSGISDNAIKQDIADQIKNNNISFTLEFELVPQP